MIDNAIILTKEEYQNAKNNIRNSAYQQGAREFAEWLLHQDKVLYSSVSNVFFTYDYEHSTASIMSIDEVLAEMKKGTENDV